MVETEFSSSADATALAAVVNETRAQLTPQLPSGRVAPLFSTNAAGAVVDRQGKVVREPVKRATPGAP